MNRCQYEGCGMLAAEFVDGKPHEPQLCKTHRAKRLERIKRIAQRRAAQGSE